MARKTAAQKAEEQAVAETAAASTDTPDVAAAESTATPSADENPTDTPSDASVETPAPLWGNARNGEPLDANQNGLHDSLEAAPEPEGFTLPDPSDEAAAAVSVESAPEANASVEEVSAEELAEALGIDLDSTEDLEALAALSDVDEDAEYDAAGTPIENAVSPLSAPEDRPVVNPIEQDSNPNVPEGQDRIVAAYAERSLNSWLEASDGGAIDPETLFLGPDVAGTWTSTVRVVRKSFIEPYGHKASTLVLGVGVPVSDFARREVLAALAEQNALADDAESAEA